MGFLSGLGGIVGGLFGNSGDPYKQAMKQYQQAGQKAEQFQNPFLQAGQRGLGNFENWLQGMQDPAAFYNNLMGQYQQSPWAQYQQQQGLRAANNFGSASGLTGSTPLLQQAQQNAQNISSQDQGNWVSQVLGINSQYGAGQQNLAQGGQNAANALTNFYGGMAGPMGDAAYGKAAGRRSDLGSILGGAFDIGSSFFGL